MYIFPFGEVDDESPAVVRLLAYATLVLHLQLRAELRAWCEGLEDITFRINNWTYLYVNRPIWNAFYARHGYKCDQEKEYIIATALMTHRGRLALAEAMVEPIRRCLESPALDHFASMRREIHHDIADYASRQAVDAIRKEEDGKVLEHLSRAAA
jgi:hypothetical protein